MAIVSPGDAVAVTYRVILRQLVSTGRVLALSLLGIGVALVGWAVGRSSSVSGADRLDDAVGVISLTAFTLVVPIVALVFAGASLGDTREDGTLVYLWLRPMKRWTIVIGAWLAALTISLPLTVIPTVITAILLDVGGELVIATAIASIVGVIAYTAIFVLLGLAVKNAIVLGLGYIVIWEGVVALIGSAAAKVAVRGYTTSILTGRTGVASQLADSGQTAGIIVPLVVAGVALALAVARLESLEVA